jgi:hypothetical protein
MKSPFILLLFFVFIMIIIICSMVFAREQLIFYGREQFIYNGRNYTFTIESPENWSNNPVEAASNGLPFLLFPKNPGGQSSAYIYALGHDRTPESPPTIEQYIQADYQKQKAGDSRLEVRKLDLRFENLEKSRELPGIYYIYEFSGYNDGQQDIVVFIESGDGVIVIVYGAEAESYQRFYNDFITVIKSFVFTRKSL